MKDEKGSVIIEVALMMPLLLMIVFGFIGLNKMVKDSMVVQTAAREGARHYAIFHDPDEAVEIANKELESGGIKDATINIVHQPPNDRGVVVQKPFLLNIPFGEIRVFNIRREVVLHQVAQYQEEIYGDPVIGDDGL